MDKVVKKHASEHAMVVAKLKREKQRRVSAEQKLERRSEATAKARAELGSEKRKRVAAEKKVRYYRSYFYSYHKSNSYSLLILSALTPG